jgi:hypothetical protein
MSQIIRIALLDWFQYWFISLDSKLGTVQRHLHINSTDLSPVEADTR